MRTLISSLCLLLLGYMAGAQGRTVSGSVQSAGDGQPLAEATVAIKNSSNLARTDSRGLFRLNNVDSNALLVITHTGYESLEVRADKPVLTIFLQPSTREMEEVVINTGYQRLPRERATGSFSHLGQEQINLQVGTNILPRLEGLANSVLFDRNSQRPAFTVRGLSTINGPKAPLIVLNDFPYEGDINNINPNDIESITILKDAAAASIWGTRAGNGVIVITTKNGRFNQPMQIQFNSGVLVRNKPDLFYLREIASTDYIDVEQMLFSKGFYTSQESNVSRPPLTPVVELLIAKRDGRISAAEADQKINELRRQDVRNDFDRYMYRQGLNRQYALNMSGGASNLRYILSAGYDKNTSELDADYDRLTLRMANTFQPFRKLQVNTSVTYTSSSTASGRPAWGSILTNKTLYPYARFADAEGRPLPLHMYRQTYTDTAGAGKLLDWKMYPLENYKYMQGKSRQEEILGSAGLLYEIIKGLSLDVKYQYQKQQSASTTFQDLQSYATRDLINRFSQLNRSTGAVRYIVPLGGIYNMSGGSVDAYNARGQVSYNLSTGQHRVAAIAGTEIRQVRTTSNSNRVYGFDKELVSGRNVDHVNAYPNFITGSNQTIAGGASFTEATNRFVSGYANAAYTYMGRYTLSGSARKDASNLFGARSNQKGVPLWSAGGSWEISKEGFYRAGFLPYLKLRATYGFSGNVDNNMSAITTLMLLNTAMYTNYNTTVVSQFANPDLKWERVKTVNAGADFRLAGNVLEGSIEYYHKEGLDLLGLAPIDYTAGLATYYLTKNVANMKGHGVDLELHARILDRGFKWQAGFNFSYNTSKVTKYFITTSRASNFTSDGSFITPLEGRPVYSLMTYRWGGLDPANGNPMGYVNGQLSTNYSDLTGSKVLIDQLVFSGPAMPPYFGNLVNTFSWKGLSLTANISYKLGHYFRRKSIDYSILYSSGIGHSDFALRWKKPGDEQFTQVPSQPYPAVAAREGFYTASEALATSASHVRLQFINLSYDWNAKNRRLPFRNLQFYANASNLGLIWRANKFGLDPDYPSSLPAASSFAFGIRGDF
ncbi:MAG TPA: SusC/RagA family TonB-linked outer membrane protein [Flavisolibacter sp.]|jgi:TonB-linked SusC/RagA family outer membrane protein